MIDLLKKRSFGAMALCQFVGAFNDNAFKILVLLLAASLDGENAPDWVRKSELAQGYGQGLVATLFALPFVIFGPLTGALADKLSKSSIIRLANLLQIAVMGMGTLALALLSFDGLLVVVFLMGAQSALFGPSKYGVIKELVGEVELGRANALIQSSTMIAILCGNVVGGFIAGHVGQEPWIAGLWYMAFASLGWMAALRIERLPALDPDRAILWNPLAEFRHHWRGIRGNRRLKLAVLASSLFYALAALFTSVVVQYGTWLGLPSGAIPALNVPTITGIGLGAMVAGRFCRNHVEGGLIPMGLLGMAFSGGLVVFAPRSIALLCTSLFGIGFSTGLFTIPIRVLIQGLPADDQRGSVQGLAETLDFVGILVAGLVFILLEKQMGFGALPNYLIGAALSLVLGLTSLVLVGEYALRFGLLILCRTFYRIRVHGVENLPERGGVVLVANHVSWIDAVVIAASCPRPVRFLMYRGFFDVPLLGWFARRMGTIPISSRDNLEQREEALLLAARKAQEGEIVCIFAEGAITRTGSMSGFATGFERIASEAKVPVVPVALDRLWGSIFSYHGGRVLWKRPESLVYRVDVAFGPAEPQSVRAPKLRRVIQELIADLRATRKGRRGSLAWRFLYSARRQGSRPAMVDSTGKRLNYRQLVVAALVLKSVLARNLGPKERVAVLLPPSVGGALANLSLALLRRASVNLNYSLSSADLQVPLRLAGVEHVITSRAFLKGLGANSPLPEEQTLYLEDLAQQAGRWDKVGAFLSAWLPASWLANWRAPQRNSDEVATVIFSSGSTGEPKGVQLTHGNVLSNVQSTLQVLALGPGDTLLGILPFFHSFGYTVTLWANLIGTSKSVYHSNPLEAKRIGKICGSEGVTVMLATPSFYQSYLRRCDPSGFRNLRLAVSGAQKLPAGLASAWRSKMGSELLDGYGTTELSPVVAVNTPGSETRGPRHHTSREGSVGKPIPGVAVRIVDPDSGEELDTDLEGLVEVKGPNVMLGYLKRPDLTAEVIRDGWYSTGDIGRLDVDGFLWITDRLARFSKIGGEMVPHGRVEEALLQELAALGAGDAPASEESRGEAPGPDLAVTAIEHPTRGEDLIVLHANLPVDSAVLARALGEGDLPALFRPRPSNYFPVDEIPMLATGKLDLRGMRELARTLGAGSGTEV